MPSKKSDTSFANDFAELKSLDGSTLRSFSETVGRKRLSEKQLNEALPDFFLRLLKVHDVIVEHLSRTTGEIKGELGGHKEFYEWFQKEFPGIRELPQYGRILQFVAESMGDFKISTEEDSEADDTLKHIAQSMAPINSVQGLNQLFGESSTPHMRVFFLHNDRLLLDSTGDWDDWSYVARILIRMLSNHAMEIEDIPGAWEHINFEKVLKHVKETKKALNAFEKNLKAKMEPQAPRRKAKKRK